MAIYDDIILIVDSYKGDVLNMYEPLTYFIKKLAKEKCGEWYGWNQQKEGVLTLPFVVYSVPIHQFIDAVYAFVDAHEKWNLRCYNKLIEEQCAKYQVNDVSEIKISALDGKTTVAYILSIIRGDRFCEGLLFNALEDGTIMNLLKRLEEIDGNEYGDYYCHSDLK